MHALVSELIESILFWFSQDISVRKVRVSGISFSFCSLVYFRHLKGSVFLVVVEHFLIESTIDLINLFFFGFDSLLKLHLSVILSLEFLLHEILFPGFSDFLDLQHHRNLQDL